MAGDHDAPPEGNDPPDRPTSEEDQPPTDSGLGQSRATERRANYYGQGSSFVINTPRTPEAHAHLEKLARLAQPTSELQSLLAKVETRRIPARRQVLDLDTARQVLENIYRGKLYAQKRVFDPSDEEKEIIDNVLRYFIGDPTSTLPLNKGLFIFGATGSGKTWLLEVMRELMHIIQLPRMQFGFCSVRQMDLEIQTTQSVKIVNQLTSGGLWIDDFGREKREVTLYGNGEAQTYKPIELLLSIRYDRFIQLGQFTHFTSNLLYSKLEDDYEETIADRIAEMVTPVLLTSDKSKRR